MRYALRLLISSVTLSFWVVSASAQDEPLTKDDTLRGSITPQRIWWDLTYYHLSVKASPQTQSLSGKVLVNYTVLTPYQTIQIDLQPPLTIDSVVQDGERLNFKKEGKNAYMINLPKEQQPKNSESIIVYFSGTPIVATNPPWQGGVQWVKDEDGNTLIATSCQGLGASAWWPCKDHMYDEPDSMLISVTVPEKLQDVSNGRLREVVDNLDGTKTFNWFVGNPINNYGVNMNIANYVHFADTVNGELGRLDLDYYVLPYNLQKAKEQFAQAKKMIKAFEYWFGPYPFYKDGFKLVEVPYLGMEHQSSVTYGNGFKNGYLGRDLSGTGWGLKWDFIIVHESGHEWFANNITYKDIADMWIHESFTNYSESLFTEYYYGKEAATEYVNGTRKSIRNENPIIGMYNVNKEGSGDMYSKGGNMIHTIRHSINDDKLFREILRGLNAEFYHQTVTSQQIENYISAKAKFDYSKVFDQYLRNLKIPTFEFYFEGKKVFYRWTKSIDKFNLPLSLSDGKIRVRIEPTTEWKSKPISDVEKKLFDAKRIERDYYISAEKIIKKEQSIEEVPHSRQLTIEFFKK
jgi:aminopeptidase N